MIAIFGQPGRDTFGRPLTPNGYAFGMLRKRFAGDIAAPLTSLAKIYLLSMSEAFINGS